MNYLLSFLVGALALSAFSLIQKHMLGLEDIFVLKGFVVPSIIGGITGLALMLQYSSILRASDRFRQSQENLQDFLDNASDLIQSVGADGKFLYVNDAWREALKYNDDDIQRLTVFDIIHSDWLAHCQLAFQRIMKGELVGHIETIFVAKDGKKIHVAGNVNCRIVNRVCVSTRGIFRDITSEHQALEQGRLTRKVFESVQEAIVVTDSKGVVKAVNPVFSAITGYTAAETIDRPIYEILRSDDSQPSDSYKLSMRGPRPVSWDGELIGRRKNGESFHMRLAISHIWDEHDNVENYVGIFSDITERKRLEKSLEHLATHDSLTDLPNRVLFQKRLDAAIEKAEESGNMFAVLFLDLDEFKSVNDKFGHDIGDELIQSLASRVSSAVRKSDLVARMGGDEFAIILEFITDTSQATRIAQKIIENVSTTFGLAGEQIQVTMSIGISFYPKSNTPRALLKDADLAMYQAKREGRNTFRVF